MTTDDKLRLAVSVARAAARSGEYRQLGKLNELVPPEGGEPHVHDREFKL
jgi:hypothetical protein